MESANVILEQQMVNFQILFVKYEVLQVFKSAMCAKGMLYSEEEPDKPLIKRIDCIIHNTSEKLNIPLYEVEDAFFSEYIQPELFDNRGKKRRFNEAQLKRELWTAYDEICRIVNVVAERNGIKPFVPDFKSKAISVNYDINQVGMK